MKKIFIMTLFVVLLLISGCSAPVGSENSSDILTGISVTSLPKKTEYFVGDVLDLKGMVVIAFYGSNVKNVTNDITVSGFDSSSDEEDQVITVSYKENEIEKTDTFTVKIIKRYEFHENIEKVDTVVIDGVSYDIVTFGDYPQSIKEKDVVIDYTSYYQNGSMKYYSGSDGCYYVKNEEVTPYASGYLYSDGKTSVLKGNLDWFKVEPIRWRVLSDDYSNGKTLLLSESILESWEYYDGSYRYYVSGSYNSYGVPVYSISNVKKNFDNDFIKTAFTRNAENKLIQVVVNGGGGSSSGALSGVKTETDEKIFILKQTDIKADYGFSEDLSKVKTPSDFVLAKGEFEMNIETRGSPWYLRFTDYEQYSFLEDGKGIPWVSSLGKISKPYKNGGNLGIVPAICVIF